MRKQVRVIKTKAEYDAAIANLSALMDEDFAPGSDEEADFELLSLVIEEYEREVVGPVNVDPVDAILFRMDQLRLTKKDMVPYFGSLPRVSEVLARKRSLSLSMIRSLNAKLGISAEILIGSDEALSGFEEKPKYNYSKFPLKEMFDRKFFEEADDFKKIKDDPEDAVIKFFDRCKTGKQNYVFHRAPLHQNNERVMDEYALLIWHTKVLHKASNLEVKNKYVEGSITKEWLSDLAKLSRFDKGPKLAQECLADNGIKMVIEKHFKKTYLDGAAMLDKDVPIVALTLRHDRIDNFWFALMHELIHVDKHLKKGTEDVFIADNFEDKVRSSEIEDEADEGAREALIPLQKWSESTVKLTPKTKNVISLAKELRIHPAIIAGRVRHETQNWRILRNLLGETGDVGKHFENQI